MSETPRPTIGITMGDPLGVGAEIIVKALGDPELRSLARFVIYGLNEQMTYAADLAEIEPFWWRDQADSDPRRSERDVIVLDYDEYSVFNIDARGPSEIGGKCSCRFLIDAAEHAIAGKIDALVNGPTDRAAWKLAGLRPGTTPLVLKQLTGSKCIMRMSMAGPLRVTFATPPGPLHGVTAVLSIGRVHDAIDLTSQFLRTRGGLTNPRIIVCSLNPTEPGSGWLGYQEELIIEPAIGHAVDNGCQVIGPMPAEQAFDEAARGKCDAVVALYHDQGRLPLSCMAKEAIVHVTLGLPLVSIELDHGAQYEQAGRGKADPAGMQAALRQAVRLARSAQPAP